MADPTAQRTLVKSPPEIWAEVSDAAALARHLGEFGDIRIIRLEHESTVAWEGDATCGTVELEPAGWGTKVTLTATHAAQPAPPPTAVLPAPATSDPAAAKVGFLARILGRRGAPPAPRAVPTVPAAPPAAPTAQPPDAAAVLDGVLDTLGAAHHRPFSRG